MTGIKFCGLRFPADIQAANAIRPDYVGFVFAPSSSRFVTREKAAELKAMLSPGIKAVGVFVNEKPEVVAGYLKSGVADIAQLHGSEDDSYIAALRRLTDKPIIQAFRIRSGEDLEKARRSPADFILLDSGSGTGRAFDWSVVKDVGRPYFLAGGLDAENVALAIRQLHPFAVDVSSGIETDRVKDERKMAAFAASVREEE